MVCSYTYLELVITAINYIFNPIHGQRRFGNVRGHNAFTRTTLCALEDLRLEVGG